VPGGPAVASYGLFSFDSKEHTVRADEVDCPSDGEALAAAERFCGRLLTTEVCEPAGPVGRVNALSARISAAQAGTCMDKLLLDTRNLCHEVQGSLAAFQASKADFQLEMLEMRAEAEHQIQKSRNLLQRLNAKKLTD
jgi:hypothetical protein